MDLLIDCASVDILNCERRRTTLMVVFERRFIDGAIRESVFHLG